MPVGNYTFIHGSIEKLNNINTSSINAVILSNILDNLYSDDVEILLRELNRVISDNGKVLVKLNPWLTQQEIDKYELDVIQGNLLDDGMLLLNQNNTEWKNIFLKYFNVIKYEDVLFSENEQANRLFYLTKK